MSNDQPPDRPQAVDLFSGTGSFAKVAIERGFSVDSYDTDKLAFVGENAHSFMDILNSPDGEWKRLRDTGVSRLWASPPCQGFSVAVIGRNWHKDTGQPKTDSARLGLALMAKTVDIVRVCQPLKWYIENPRGMMRKKIEPYLEAAGLDWVRHTVTYCQYGDTRQKPTDIWTNDLDWKPLPMCSPSRPGKPATCHEPAPRGSRTGTQGVKGARNRSIVPELLIREILESAGESR